MKSDIELHKELLMEIHELYKRKNADYGNSFSETYQIFGEKAMLARLYDKAKRFTNLMNMGSQVGQQVKDESWEDTLDDLVGYWILLKMERAKNPKGDIPGEGKKVKEPNSEEVDMKKRIRAEMFFLFEEYDSGTYAIHDVLNRLLASITNCFGWQISHDDSFGDTRDVVFSICLEGFSLADVSFGFRKKGVYINSVVRALEGKSPKRFGAYYDYENMPLPLAEFTSGLDVDVPL